MNLTRLYLSLLNSLPKNNVYQPLLVQLIRSSTSIGANYHEVSQAESRKDFLHKLGICRKETNETLYWIEMIAYLYPDRKKELRELWKEAKEFLLIFSKAVSTTRLNKK